MANEKSIVKVLSCRTCRKKKHDHTGKRKVLCCGVEMRISDIWHVRLTDKGKTTLIPVSSRKQDAIDYLHAKKDAIRRKQLMPGEEENISWEVARGEFVKSTLTMAKDTIRFYANNLQNLEKVDLGGGVHFPDLDLDEIEPRHMMALRDARLKQVSPKTTLEEMGTLTKLFKTVLKNRTSESTKRLRGILVDLQNVDQPKVNNKKSKCLDAEGVDHLLSHIIAPHLRLMFIIGVKTGLRKKNILALRRSQINLEQRLITIPRQEMKNKRREGDLTIPIDEELAGLLKDWMVQNKCFDYLFPSPVNPTKHMTNIGTGVYAAFKRAKLNEGETCSNKILTWHTVTRHTAATFMVEHSEDIFSVAKILDDTVEVVEKNYAKKVQRKMAEVVATVGDKIRLVK
jgi:integrase